MRVKCLDFMNIFYQFYHAFCPKITPLPENNEAVFTIWLVITSRPENPKYEIFHYL